MRRPRLPVRNLMIAVAVVAMLLMVVRSRMVGPPQATMAFGAAIFVEEADGRGWWAGGKIPYPSRHFKFPLVTIVEWSDGSFSVYFPTAESREPR